MTAVIRFVCVASIAALASACAQPIRCGARGEPCCVDEVGNVGCLAIDPAVDPFAPPLQCIDGSCQGVGGPMVCGGLAQVCCPGAAPCTGALTCDAGTCQAASGDCGALGQACCGGTGCTGTLVCNAGACQMPPAGTACPGPTGACDIGLQDCGPSQACTLTIDNTTSCRAAGIGVDQSPCAGDTDCAVGHYCSPFSGRCHSQCCGDADCGSQQVCIATGATSDAGLCFGSPCDPVDGSGCASSAACFIAGNPAGGVMTLCLPPNGSGVTGSACDGVDACLPGYVCLGSPGACAELCRPSAPACSAGSCAPLEGVTDTGVCQ